MKQNNRMPVFRERLRQLMGEMSVTEFANTIGLSRQTLGFYLNGNRIPDCEMLVQICNKCNVSANWLLGLSDTKSLDTNVAAVMQYTGLTEDNVNYLHDSSTFGRDEPLNIYKKSLFILINDLIEICKLHKVNTRFYQIMRLASAFEGEKAHAGDSVEKLFAEGNAKKWGYAVLPVNESIEFYASQLVKQIEQAIVNKYSVAEINGPSGKTVTIEINGKPEKIWVE